VPCGVFGYLFFFSLYCPIDCSVFLVAYSCFSVAYFPWLLTPVLMFANIAYLNFRIAFRRYKRRHSQTVTFATGLAKWHSTDNMDQLGAAGQKIARRVMSLLQGKSENRAWVAESSRTSVKDLEIHWSKRGQAGNYM